MFCKIYNTSVTSRKTRLLLLSWILIQSFSSQTYNINEKFWQVYNACRRRNFFLALILSKRRKAWNIIYIFYSCPYCKFHIVLLFESSGFTDWHSFFNAFVQCSFGFSSFFLLSPFFFLSDSVPFHTLLGIHSQYISLPLFFNGARHIFIDFHFAFSKKYYLCNISCSIHNIDILYSAPKQIMDPENNPGRDEGILRNTTDFLLTSIKTLPSDTDRVLCAQAT